MSKTGSKYNLSHKHSVAQGNQDSRYKLNRETPKQEKNVSFNTEKFKQVNGSVLEYDKNTIKICNFYSLNKLSVGIRSSLSILGKVNGKQSRIIFDTGSTISALDAKLASNLKINKCNDVIFGADRGKIDNLGTARINVCISGVNFPVVVKIIRNLSVNLILGMDFAEKFSADLDYDAGRLKLCTPKAENVEIPMSWSSENQGVNIRSAGSDLTDCCAALHMVAKVNNQRLKVLLDSGSCCNVIDRRFVRRQDIFRTEQVQSLTTANNHSLKIIGVTELRIEINGTIFEDLAFVAENLSASVILGNHFFEKHSAKIITSKYCNIKFKTRRNAGSNILRTSVAKAKKKE